MKEKKARVEDALHATRAAVEEGVIPGGGVALLRTSQVVRNTKGDNHDQDAGIKIVLRALEQPLREIVANAGDEPSVVVDKVQRGKGNYGYNATTGDYGDMVEMGVLDPTKVTRTALQNAASVAGLMLTTECMVAELAEDKPAGGMPDMGGAGPDVAAAEPKSLDFLKSKPYDQLTPAEIKKIEERRTALKKLEVRQLLTEAEYWELQEKWNTGTSQPIFQAGMGAEAIRDIVAKADLERMAKELRKEIRTTRSKQRRKKAAKRLRVVEIFRKSGNRPEWMVMTTLPVIPSNCTSGRRSGGITGMTSSTIHSGLLSLSLKASTTLRRFDSFFHLVSEVVCGISSRRRATSASVDFLQQA
jgi:hypothetical protein